MFFSTLYINTLAQLLLDEPFHKFWPAVETGKGEEMKDAVNPVILVKALNLCLQSLPQKIPLGWTQPDKTGFRNNSVHAIFISHSMTFSFE